MAAIQLLFIVVAVVTLFAALMVVTQRNLVRAALWLVLTLFGVAVLFAVLNAGFLAVAQVVIYIGAIAILMIFAIMLTRRVATDSGPQLNSSWGWAAGLASVIFAGLFWLLSTWGGFASPLPALGSRADPLTELGAALVSPNAYVLPFEVASVLLLAALIGSIMVAWERK
ncbi:MAG: NADH-quinone oxidoreductase subunit J [Chloroflexi bacterium]|nr:NADH-quinone oxidoreductase subunit J [Chloroflexota bacterium]